MKAFIGIFEVREALKVNIHSSNKILYHESESSNDTFTATMSLKRFQFLKRVIGGKLTSLHASEIFSKPK